MNLYTIDIRIYGTAYIKAETVEEAQVKVRRFGTSDLIFPDDVETLSDVKVSGLRLDDPDLPEISLSPCFTVWGTEPDAIVELSEENIDGA